MVHDPGPQMFHDGPVSHTHQSCANCFQFQRSHGRKLSRCAGCLEIMYCSKECQLADRPAHKQTCKVLTKEREAIEADGGLQSAMAEFHAWVAYYNMPLQNCAIAAMELPERPHLEKHAVLCIRMWHKRDSSLPLWDKFEVMTIGREGLGDLPREAPLPIQPAQYERACEKGRIELGRDFYGVVRYVFLVHFGKDKRIIHTAKMRHFAISHEIARTRSLRADWWVLLREYINNGTKMRFCCGKIPIPHCEDICCCGGWVHDAEKRGAFSKLG
ncbi:hypothetical protein K438DRAFT_242583 [Mycena galopus ATCC 62051]|nr:hypothetical protein K438DRAFT_242583 [Mycena galopus ATCC 62051]